MAYLFVPLICFPPNNSIGPCHKLASFSSSMPSHTFPTPLTPLPSLSFPSPHYFLSPLPQYFSLQDVSELERMIAVCPDAFKSYGEVSCQPVDLGDAKQHTYFLRRRSGLPGDEFVFGEVFVERPWQVIPLSPIFFYILTPGSHL